MKSCQNTLSVLSFGVNIKLLFIGGVIMNIENCTQCQHHTIVNDRDPDDWFCDDDVAVLCSLTPNPKIDKTSKYLSDHQAFRAITVACRPYNIQKESQTPQWCPLKQK